MRHRPLIYFFYSSCAIQNFRYEPFIYLILMVSDSTSETVAQRIDALLLRIEDYLHSRHVVFQEELKKTALMADLVDVTLWAEEGNGKVSREIITVPGQIFEPGTDRYAKLLEYIAVCLNIRGETLGIQRIGIETSPELNTDRLINDVKEYFEREFFKYK